MRRRVAESLPKHNARGRGCAELFSYINRCFAQSERFLEETMRSNAKHAVAAVTAAAIALTTAGTAPAFAASKTSTSVKPVETSAANTDISSRRYHRGHRYRNNAAGAAAFAAIIGGIATYAAAREYRKARERSYYYGGGPYGYYGNGYYGGGHGYYRRGW
jgi:hypothetical protein